MAKIFRTVRWVAWGLAALFFLCEYSLRVCPSVMVREMMTTFAVSASAIGMLSACYFAVYAPMQLVAGPLIDKFGAIKLLAVAALFASIGSAIFALAPNLQMASVGRILTGMSTSFVFVGIVFISSKWFEKSKRGLLIGLGNGMGMLGGIIGQGPMRKMIEAFGWRGSLIYISIFVMFLGLCFTFLFRYQPPINKEKTPKLTEALKRVAKEKQTWINSMVGLFLFMPTAAFAGLWAIPYVRTVYELPLAHAGFAVAMVFAGWIVGGPLVGILSDKTKEIKRILQVSSLLGLATLLLILYVSLSHFLLYCALFFLGVASSAELLNFGYAIDLHPDWAKGTTTAFTNFIVMLGVAALQPIVGFLLDRNWIGSMDGGARIYQEENYHRVLAIFPISMALAFVFSCFLKRKAKA